MFPFERIVCPTDFSDPSLCSLKMGNEMATRFGSRIIVVNVHKPIPQLATPRIDSSDFVFDITNYEKHVVAGAHEHLTTIADSIFDADITPKLVVRVGRPSQEILALADEENADAIFIATHGRTGLKHVIFGSVAEKVVRRATCPVLTIRACD